MAPYDGPMEIGLASDELIQAGRRLGARGLISAGEGNLSIRLDGSRILVTPSGRRKDELRAEDLVVVRTDHPGAAARSRSGFMPTSDLAIHLAVYAARPDIEAVAHAHLPASMALTLAGEIPDPAVLPETALFLPRLPFLTLGVPGSQSWPIESRPPSWNLPIPCPAPSCWNATAPSPSVRTSTGPWIGWSWLRSSAVPGATRS